MARCPDCNKHKTPEWNGEFEQIELDIDETGLPTAEYEFTLGCSECGTDMLTGNITFDVEDVSQKVADFIELHDEETKVAEVRDKALDKFLTDNKLEMAWDGNMLSDDEKKRMEEALDAAEYEYNEKRVEELREAYFVRHEAMGWPRSQVEIEGKEDLERILENFSGNEFQIEEVEVEVSETKVDRVKVWAMEVKAKITDAKHPEWEGEEITLKGDIQQAAMEEVG